jgi:hypothetical protein
VTADVSEKIEQANIVALLRAIGATVYVLGHPSQKGSHRGTGQTPGVPDLLAFLVNPPAQVWIEVKRQGGKIRPEQEAFRELCDRSDVAHIIGTCDDVLRWLGVAP